MPFTVDELKESPDFYFRYMLHDTLILLGCDKKFAKLLKQTLDKPATYEELSELMNYNIYLITQCKGRLMNLNTGSVKPTDSE